VPDAHACTKAATVVLRTVLVVVAFTGECNNENDTFYSEVANNYNQRLLAS